MNLKTGVSRKQSTPKFPKNEHQRVRNVSFFGKIGMLCFLETSVLRFALLPYYRRVHLLKNIKNNLCNSRIFIEQFCLKGGEITETY